jgi:HD-like signal output (HDOD) protein
LDRQAFYRKLDSIRELPTLPEVVVQLNMLLDSSDTTIDQVSETIEKDQAIVGKMLRLVNSSFFGWGAKVTTVSRAVVILGFNTVRNALVSVSIIDSTRSFHGSGIDMKNFWRHAISCAVIGKYLSSRSGIGLPEEAFTVGVLHDIGKLVLAKFFQKEFSYILEKTGTGESFYKAESGVVPVHHNEIGAYLARRWHLPQVICDGIRFSHGITSSSQYPIANLVLCADRIVTAGCLDDSGDGVVDFAPGEMPAQVKPVVESRELWLPEIVSETNAACSMLLMGGEDEG